MGEAEERVARALEQRGARAQTLVEKFPAADEPLRFAAGLYRAQAAVRLTADFGAFAEAVQPVIRFVASSGPPGVAADARTFSRDRLSAYWGGLSEFDYLSRAVLMPYARFLRESGVPPGRPEGPCKVCGGAPWIATRRSASSADGAMRMLVCALCGFEWQTARIRCPACGEEDPKKLPVFSAQERLGARIEACETCRGYVKSIDLTLDARQIPEVDDLATLSLDLWASEQGFERLEPGLAGI
ncbi:MAG: formate dehydrogenase accessory protein FdhE [Myxococcales bacterium]|nr:formate dehydrogenase accessory protein FdhE [Myxococcales bacterium]